MSMEKKCVYLLLTFLLMLSLGACQSKLGGIGQEHALEVKKWQELANYAGNELKPLGLTITTDIQINQNANEMSFSIVNVQLNRSSNTTEIDLLSPTFAEKFACNDECQNLGLYDSSFTPEQTQLAKFFFEEEGRFFEFYGKLTQLNQVLEFYRTSAPEILNKYLTLMLKRNMKFNSLSDFMQYFELHITEDKLLAFSQSGFISPVEDRLSPNFVDDLIAAIPNGSRDKTSTNNTVSLAYNNWISADESWLTETDTTIGPDKHWVKLADDMNMPDKNWSSGDNDLERLDTNWQISAFNNYSSAEDIDDNWNNAKQHDIQVGTIVCSFSDNSFGLVKEINDNTATLDVIAQARLLVDGINLYAPAGYLFSAVNYFDFVKSSSNETYALSDLATCDLAKLTRSQI